MAFIIGSLTIVGLAFIGGILFLYGASDRPKVEYIQNPLDIEDHELL